MQYDIEDRLHVHTTIFACILCGLSQQHGLAAFSEIGKSASRSVSSLKFYFRTTVAWPLLRHNIIRNEQGIFRNNANDCMTLGN